MTSFIENPTVKLNVLLTGCRGVLPVLRGREEAPEVEDGEPWRGRLPLRVVEGPLQRDRQRQSRRKTLHRKGPKA